MDGAFSTYWTQPASSLPQLDTVKQALEATLNPRVSNEVRQHALQHLEALKNQPDAPHYGFTLAEDWNQNDAVRYYGLQLLEYAVRHRWNEFGDAQTEQLRTWIKCLAGSLRVQDALFLRNKVAQVWVELAKRCWGDEWTDMDQLLVALWDKSLQEKGVVNKIFVLYVLETLSEEIVNSEDAVAGLRIEVLGTCLDEIMIPQGLWEEYARTRSGRKGIEVRVEGPGWLARMCAFFADCVKQATLGGDGHQMARCAIKALNAMRPTMNWVSLKAAVEAKCVDCCFVSFHTDDVALQTAATETLYVLLNRPYGSHWHEAWVALQRQALQPDRVAVVRQAFDRTAVAPGEDEEKYTLQKKMSEFLAVLADNVSSHPDLLSSKSGDTCKVDVPDFFDLLLYVLQSKSLVVSIPVLHSWSKTMAVTAGSIVDILLKALDTLIQTCSERLLRYENLQDNLQSGTEDEVLQFLDEDFDTIPERHAFLGNYRRYCTSIIQAIARIRPSEALQHVLADMRRMLESGPYTSSQGFQASSYSKDSLAVLRFDAQFNVVVAALKGFQLWVQDISALTWSETEYMRAENDKASAEQSLREWSQSVIGLQVDDPEVAAQVLQTLVSILRAVEKDTGFVLVVVQRLLTMRVDDQPAYSSFSDAVKGLEGWRVLELQKLALAFAPELLEVYQELEPRIEELAQRHSDDPRLVWGFKAFLFMIIHRAPGIEPQQRMGRLQQMLQPVYQAWSDPNLGASVQKLDSFCAALGMRDLPNFYKSYRFDRIQDWSAHQLDDAGKARQNEIREAGDRVPLRITKSLLGAATEKLQSGSEEFEMASTLWSTLIPTILPNLLHMLRQAQAFHQMQNWSRLPEELQYVVKRTLQDRFWQSGISNESKEEFYRRISGSKTSYEGFASTVRGTMRGIREQGYHVLYLLTKFDEQFYGLTDLAEPLAAALFADAGALSANHLHPIINLTTGLVQRCPPKYQSTFLPPLLKQLFVSLDAKILAEWAAIAAAEEKRTGENDELGDEMRTESVLRQLTYSMVSFVPFLLEFDKQQRQQQQQQQHQQGSNGGVPPPTNGHAPEHPLSDLIFNDPTILEPLLLFSTHTLRIHDTRSVSTITRVFRNLLPVFTATSTSPAAPQVREYIASEVLKATISSLNEPYFADLQRDLAGLIAQIIALYADLTGTVRGVLMSLPNMGVEKVERVVGRLVKAGGTERLGRSLVLELLEGVRGVSIYEAGRIPVGAGGKKKGGGVAEKYAMEVEQGAVVQGGGEEGLDGLAGMFGND
ncbi:hypothetical protein EJ03DRAFT_381697 [Teratosphaeria nubilosa]|uniref:ARM repeat-containing protein n=1 Tax=Teratosphaeria nubilosa TaxID=161662 RepID=A0A6G1LFJ5_9PEZI|nr:hypothetical protein EJ03DRAFT_381697 [Teratosphaeria nubilosa]